MIPAIVSFALRQRAIVLVAAGLLTIFGILSFRALPIEAYPDVGDTWVQVITQWPGHAPEEVERQITIPLERQLNGTPRQASIRSVSIAGLSVVTLVFQDRVDGYFARQQVSERIAQVDLPDGAESNLGPLASPVGEILRYRLVNCAQTDAIECKDEDRAATPRSLSELKDIEEWVVERELLGVQGVADVASFGGTTKQYQVIVDPKLLAAEKLTFADVEDALGKANGNAGGGSIAFGPAALNVRGLGLLAPEQIADVPITVRDGTPIRVRQVGRVSVGFRPRLGRVSVNDDDDVVAATVLLRKGEAAETVLSRLHEKIDDVNGRVLPRGVKLSPYHDRTALMKITTTTVLKNLAEGLALVTIVLVVFLGNARAALIVGVTIPLALLFAFICMNRADIPANLLSIGAIDFGMLVDGSIVVVENVFRQITEKQEKKQDFDLRETIRTAASEVSRPVVFAIAIIVTAYLPIFTLERVEGKLFAPMAWTVAFALLGALLLAITLVPVLATFLFRGKLTELHNRPFEALKRGYLALLRRAIARPRLAFVLAACFVLADLAMARSIGSEFLPHLDEGAIWMRATLPANVSMAEAERLTDGPHAGEPGAPGLRQILGKYPEVQTMAVQLGRPDDGMDATGFYNVEVLMVLKDRAAWRPEFHGVKDELIGSMSRDLSVIPGVQFGFSQPISDNVEEATSGVKGQLAIKVSGDDLNALDDLADQIARAIAGIDGIVDLGIFRELGQSNVDVRVARERAERYGLTVADVEAALERGVGGRKVTEIVEGERRHDLVVRYQADARDSVDVLRALPLTLPNGAVVPLGTVADITIEEGASRIYREASRRYVAIKFGVRGRDLGSAVAEAQKKVGARVHFPPGYDATWAGEFESAERAGRRLAWVIPGTLIGIFILLFAMFRRPKGALLVLGNVLITSPLGGLAALLVTHTNFSVASGVGFLALFGVSVQTGVILVTYMNEIRTEGLSRDAAILRAAELRFRPVLMTALVATLGLLPAALSHGIGSDSQKPLAIVVVGGLFSSLSLSVFTLPMLYKFFTPNDHGLSPESIVPR